MDKILVSKFEYLGFLDRNSLYIWIFLNSLFAIVWILELIIDRFDKDRILQREQFFQELKAGFKLKHVVVFSLVPLSLAAPILVCLVFRSIAIIRKLKRMLVSLGNIQIVKFKNGGNR